MDGQDVTAPAPVGAIGWLKGRADRREYWAQVALLIALSFALSSFAPIVSLVMTVLLMLVQARRLHDLGRSGWWAVVATLLPLAPLVLLIVASFDAVMLICTVIELVLIVLMGALPGQPQANRFGPPPVFSLLRVLTGR
jgi:uncharacterized membrane protein YhaH (DUF805 family)